VARKRDNQAVLERAVQFIEKCEPHHDELMRTVDSRADAYHGIVRTSADASQWESQLYGKYAMHIVNTTLSSMVEDRLRFRIKPRLTMDELLDQDKMEQRRLGAKAHEILMNWQNTQSKFTRIQRPFLLQNAIAGITVAKTSWVERVERRRRMVSNDEPLLDHNDKQIIHPAHGPMTYPTLTERTESLPVYDGPYTEVVDIHDFYWPENARNMTEARYVAHRTWISKEDLQREFADGGMYGEANGGWSWATVEKLIGDGNQRDKSANRWGGKKMENTHDKDRLEVIEVWDTFEKEVVTFVNRSALIGYKQKFPFFHERTPFTVCTTEADLFEFVGISQVEKVAALQEMLWGVQNRSLDNLRLINSAITIYRPDVEDPEALEFVPGAMWPLEDPSQVEMWSPNPMPAEISINRERLLQGDMQNLAGSFPFSSGAESQTVDQKTATGASIVSGLAQRSIDLGKQPVYDAMEDIGNDKLVLNNQFITEPQAATVLGLDGEEQMIVIWPELLEGDYHYEQEPIPDAVMQQQEQAKWSSALQIALGAIPVVMPLAQMGMAKMINIDAFIEENLKALGIEDTQRFFKAASPPPGAQAPGAPGSTPAAGDGAPNLGITAGEGGGAPGSQINESPDVSLQRALAMGQGGGRNA